MTLNETLRNATEQGELKLAYTILWAIQQGLVNGDNSFRDLMDSDLNHQEIEISQKQNLLGIKIVNLYTSRIDGNQFVFIFAESEMQAKMFYKSLYGSFPKSMTDASSRIDVYMWSAEEGYKTFREMKESILDFPAIAAVYEKEDKPVVQVEHEYYQKFGRKLMTQAEKQVELEKGDTLFY